MAFHLVFVCIKPAFYPKREKYKIWVREKNYRENIWQGTLHTYEEKAQNGPIRNTGPSAKGEGIISLSLSAGIPLNFVEYHTEWSFNISKRNLD